jgi:hypothetical protein
VGEEAIRDVDNERQYRRRTRPKQKSNKDGEEDEEEPEEEEETINIDNIGSQRTLKSQTTKRKPSASQPARRTR